MTTEGKSIRNTAILTFSLIGIPFFLTKCSNNENQEQHHTTHSQTPQHLKTKAEEADHSYQNRDQEIALASYTPNKNHFKATVPSIKHTEHIEIGTRHDSEITEEVDVPTPKEEKQRPATLPKVSAIEIEEIPPLPEVSELPPVTEVVEVIKTSTHIVEVPVAPKPQAVLPKVPQVETTIKETNPITPPKMERSISKVPQVESTVVQPEAVEINISKVPTVQSLVSSTKNIEIPHALDMEKFELERKLRTKIRSEKISQEKIIALKAENKHLLDQLDKLMNDKILLKNQNQKERSAKEQAVEKLLSEQNLLQERLTNEEEKRDLLQKENHKLAEKIHNLEILIQKATQATEAKKQKINELIDQQKSLNMNLNKQHTLGEQLKEEKTQLQNKITQLLSIAKESSHKASQEQEAKNKEIAQLKTQQEALETKLAKELEKEVVITEENQQLQEKIEKLLNIAKEATQKVTLEQEEQNKAFDQLNLQRDTLQGKLSIELAKEQELNNKITQLLAMAKTMSEKGDALQQEKNTQIQTLLTTKENLEVNLTTEQEKESQLKEENNKLQAQLEEVNKALAETEAKANNKSQEIQALMGQQQNLEANLTTEREKESQLKEENNKLQAQVEELNQAIETAKANDKTAQLQAQLEELNKALAEAKANDKSQEFQTLMDQQKNLESNLTTQWEKGSQLKEANEKLQIQIEELNKAIETAKANQKTTHAKMEELNKALAEAKANDKSQEIQALMNQQQNLEANLTAQQQKEAQLKEENSKLHAQIEELNKAIETIKSKDNTAQLQAKIEELNNALATSKANDKSKELQAQITALQEEKKACQQNDKSKELAQQLKEEKAKLEQLLEAKNQAEQAAKEKAQTLLKEQAATAAALLAAKEAKASLDQVIAEKNRIEAEAKKREEEAEQKKRNQAQKEAAKKELRSAFSLTHVEFKYNSMELTDKSKELLNKTAKVMKQHPDFRYVIQGHTDNTGNEAYNVKLSGQRANQVKQYLVSQGIDEALLSTKGIGSAQPIADNATKEGRFKNRRVVFEIIEN